MTYKDRDKQWAVVKAVTQRYRAKKGDSAVVAQNGGLKNAPESIVTPEVCDTHTVIPCDTRPCDTQAVIPSDAPDYEARQCDHNLLDSWADGTGTLDRQYDVCRGYQHTDRDGGGLIAKGRRYLGMVEAVA